jgi:hypothetical protein
MKSTSKSQASGPSVARTENRAPARPVVLPSRRLALFLGGLLVLLASLECLVRWKEPLFAAASHRALAKAAMLEQRPRVDILYLGTSRTQDGVSPDLVTRSLQEIAPQLGKITGFNAAFTGSSLDALISLAQRFARRPGLRVLVVELSEPQLLNGPAPWKIPDTPAVTLEDRLARVLSAKVYLVRYRSAFLLENLSRLQALLLFGPSLGGWETKGSDQVASWLGHKEKPATGFELARWQPKRLRPDAPLQRLTPVSDTQASRLSEIAGYYSGRGVRVVFVVPPVTHAFTPVPGRETLDPLFAEVARRSGCEVWDFSSLDLPRALFHDPSHLSGEGRAHFSRALAVQLTGLLNKE